MAEGFRKDDHVRRKSSPTDVGRVVNVLWNEQAGENDVRVQFGTGRIKGIPESDLEFVPTVSDPWEDLSRGRAGGAAAFVTRMTYERLQSPPSRVAASFGSARAAFYAYQFKPLLKFLENPKQRLLVVDDVGLGKTIEAGYILREFTARGDVDRVLILVPAGLRTKWKAELERRFSESFEIVRAREVQKWLTRLSKTDDPEPLRWIVSYESMRTPETVELLEKLRPQLDLVVVDEAHRLRNRSTNQHKLGAALAECADAMVFLTATPVQTGIENLFSLVHLLDPETFPDEPLFSELVEANRPALRAASLLRERPPKGSEASDSLALLAKSPMTVAVTKGPAFASLQQRCRMAPTLPREELVALQRDVSELSLTSQIISRTRRVEVMPNRAVRNAQALGFPLSPDERRFYDAVARLYRLIRPDIGGWGFEMAVLMAYRYTASCIPAAIELFRERLQGIAPAPAATTGDEDPDFEEQPEPEQFDALILAQLREIAGDQARLPTTDSKLERLKAALHGLWEDDERAGRPPRKIVLFSFFRRTLRYLSKKLAEDGVGHERIDGDLSIDEREEAIERFSSTPNTWVLLSSEVGAEGIDLQFASVIVNYDLPWNPMVVEQRIGRVDRIGQQSKTITVLNLVATGTIEETILLRLYDRIGLFRESIGEIEPILGDRIQELAKEALRGDLTEQQQKQQVDQTADAILRTESNAKELGEKADGLMAADQAFLDEIEGLIGRRRVPGAGELMVFVQSVLQRRFPGTQIPPEARNDVGEIFLPPEAAAAARIALAGQHDASRFTRRLETGRFKGTFDQDAAQRHPRAELIYTRHPLVRLALKLEEERPIGSSAFAIRLPSNRAPQVERATYAFLVWLLEMGGARPRTELATAFSRVDSAASVVDEAADVLLGCALDFGEDVVAVPAVPSAQLLDTRVRLDALLQARRQAIDTRESALDALRSQRKRATLEATLDTNVRRAQARLADFERQGAADFAVRMAQARVNKAVNDRLSRLTAATQSERFRIEYEEIASGLLIVE